jgi:hypothetical protein
VDSATHRLYASHASRVVVADINTRQSHRVYIPVAKTTPGPAGRARIIPGSMKILVLGTAP